MKLFSRKLSIALTAGLMLSAPAAAGQGHQETQFAKPIEVAFFGKSKKERRLTALKRDAARLIRKPPKTLYNETALGCIAVAVFHEARNQSITGQKAVASVVVQRSIVPDRWGDKPCDVVRPVQFSFMTSRYRFPKIDTRRESKAWQTAVRVALTVMYEGPMQELKGADHYHTTDVYPRWRKSMPVVARIEDHIFYKDPQSPRVYFVSR